MNHNDMRERLGNPQFEDQGRYALNAGSVLSGTVTALRVQRSDSMTPEWAIWAVVIGATAYAAYSAIHFVMYSNAPLPPSPDRTFVRDEDKPEKMTEAEMRDLLKYCSPDAYDAQMKILMELQGKDGVQ